MLRHPAWHSWVKLVELFCLATKHTLTVSEIETIDDLQVEHSRLYDKVPEYSGLKKPKNHFLAHVCRDAWRYGPPRGYWCFGFEGFNRIIKQGAKRSNWKNTALSIMEYYMWRTVNHLSSK